MQHSRSLRLEFLLFLITLSLITCTVIAPPKPESSPLRVVYDPWPGFLPILIAQEKGFFSQQGVKVETVFTKNAADKIPEFGADNYDGITLALGNVLTSSATDPNINIILATDISVGADAAIAQPQILTVPNLKGTRVGTRLGEFGELFVAKMLEVNGMTTDDITLTNARGEQILPLIQTDKIQAGHTWDVAGSQSGFTGTIY